MNTNVEKVTPSGVFTNYIFKSIPLAFDESMSYYECLCGLLDYLKNTVIPTINNNADAIIEIQNNVDNFETNITEDFNNFKTLINNTVQELETYMNNYFDNLDVQEEINNKLDEMAEDGFFDNLFGIIGELTNLNTTNKTDIVSAINEVNTKATNNSTNMGNLSNLETTNKTNLVNAINEINNKNLDIAIVTGTITLNQNETYASGFFNLPNGYTRDNCAVIFKNYKTTSTGPSKTDGGNLGVSLTYDNIHGNTMYIQLNDLNPEVAPLDFVIYVGLVKVNYPS